MDGFSPNSGVIVLAATNRPDVLDKALLRPGRFDRRVAVQPPDRQGRLEILRVHTRSVPLAARRRPRLDRLDDARHGRRRSRQPRQRGGAAGCAAQPQERRDGRLHGRGREDRAGRRAARDDDAGRPPAHRLSRGRARARWHADARGRPRAQGLDHPARHGAGRHVLVARRRPLQLRRGLSQGPPAGCAGGPRRRGARLRQHYLGRRVRPPAGHGDRTPDGRALGHEPGHRAGRSARRRRAAGRCCPASPRPRS